MPTRRSAEDWFLDDAHEVTLVRYRPWLALPVAHGFSTRRDGDRDDFDLGAADDRNPTMIDRRRRFLRAVGIRADGPVLLRQVHGNLVVDAAEVREEAVPEADAVLAIRGGGSSRPLAVRTADCVPILIADVAGRTLAAVHAGWRGTAAGIAPRVVAALGRAGVAPGALRALIGPAIGVCCYRVGDEVVRAVRAVTPDSDELTANERANGANLDLRLANRLQLRRAGLPDGGIAIAPWCTSCSGDLFFSYRRDGRTGRMMACLGWAGAP